MTRIEIIGDAIYAVTAFKDNFNEIGHVWQEIQNCTIENIPHFAAVSYSEVAGIYEDVLNKQVF